MGYRMVDNMTEEQKLQYIVGQYSLENRQNQLMEEMAELMQAIFKLRRTDIKQTYREWENYLEEIVDVQICLDMLKIFLKDSEPAMQGIRKDKIDRQIERIKKSYEKEK